MFQLLWLAAVWCSFSMLTIHAFVAPHSSRSHSPLSATKAEDVTHASEKKIPRRRLPKNRIITCSSSKELAVAIPDEIKPGFRVAELGAQLREVSTAVCESLDGQGSTLLVDVKRKFPSSRQDCSHTDAMRLDGASDDFYPDLVRFKEIDRLDEWRETLFGSMSDAGERYDVLVLDVSAIVGNDLEWTTLNIIHEFDALNRMIPHELGEYHTLTVLVKSLALNVFASRLVHGTKWVEQGGEHKTLPPMLVATEGVQQYRETIPVTVRPDDAVLEVGCHFGTSTRLLKKAAGYCIGVDVGSKIIKQANKKFPDIPFYVGDAWKVAELLRIQQEYLASAPETTSGLRKIGFDVVYVDVGGLSGRDGLLESIFLLNSICLALEPRCVVIKSMCMRQLSSTLIPFWQNQKRKQTVEP